MVRKAAMNRTTGKEEVAAMTDSSSDLVMATNGSGAEAKNTPLPAMTVAIFTFFRPIWLFWI